MRWRIILAVLLVCSSAFGQQYNYFINGFLQMPNAPAARNYLGITNGGGGGSGSVTNFSAGGLSYLFSSSVANPTTAPSLSFSPITQIQNTVFAGPSSVANANPTFRSLVPNDIPSLTLSKISDVGTVAGINLDGNALHFLNGNGVFTSPSGGGGSTGIDQPMTNVTAYANGTNFFIDFNWQSQTILSTGDIAFNYSTNWGLSLTGRVANVLIPPTNIFRHVLFLSSSTNWHDQAQILSSVPTGYGAVIKFSIFGQGDTNVYYNPAIDVFPTGTNWLIPTFNPTNSQGGCVFWLEPSQKTYQDEYAVTPAADGLTIRSATDLSGTFGRATNAATASFCYYYSPNRSPGNIPAFYFAQGGAAWLVTSNFSADLAQPNWAFMMFYGRGNNFVFLDGLSEGHRFACLPSETPLQTILLYSGSSLTAAAPSGLGWRLFAFKQNNTASIIRTNGVQAASGSSGTQAPGRFTVGSDYVLSTFTGNAFLAELLIYHTNLSDVQVTNIENYFRVKYGAW